MAARAITVYKNGDTHFPGKKVVLNSKQIRSIDSLLSTVTRAVRNPVAVRSIRTPNHGTRLYTLENFENGGIYVAVGSERFKKLQYSDIQGIHQPSWVSNNTLPPLVKPVHHSRVHAQATARHLQVGQDDARMNRIIHVYRNADANHPGVKLLLNKRLLLNMENVLAFVTTKVNLLTGAVKNLHDLDGKVIEAVTGIETGARYVAVGQHGRFKALNYENIVAPANITPRKLTIKKKSPLKAIMDDASRHQKAWKKHKEKKKSELDLTLGVLVESDSNDDSNNVVSPRSEKAESPQRSEKAESPRRSEKAESPRKSDDDDNWFDNMLEKIEDKVGGSSKNSPRNSPKYSPKNSPESSPRVSPKHSPKNSPKKNVVEVDPEKVFDRAVNSTKSKTSAQEKTDESTSWRKEQSRASNASNRLSAANRKLSSARSIHDEASDLKDTLVKRSTDNLAMLIDDDPDNRNDTLNERSDENPKTPIDDSAKPVDDNDDNRSATYQLDDDADRPSASNDDHPTTYDADNEADEPPVPAEDAYKASGVEAERAATVNDTKDTTMEKTIDELPAEEIDEEVEEEGGDQTQGATEDTAGGGDTGVKQSSPVNRAELQDVL